MIELAKEEKMHTQITKTVLPEDLEIEALMLWEEQKKLIFKTMLITGTLLLLNFIAW